MIDYMPSMYEYMNAVVSGDITTGIFERQAIIRAFADQDKARDSAYPYRFEPALANRVCAFMECLPHVKGDLARRRELITLEPWQIFSLAQVFGWVRKRDGMRRFTRVYEEVARKNAKSTKMSGVGLYMLALDGEEGAEVYALARSREQASIVWRDARSMVRRSPGYRKRFGVESNSASIYNTRRGAMFTTKPGLPGDGDSPSFAVIDEYHEHKTSAGYDTMYSGMGARTQPLIWVITTAGYDRSSPCYLQRSYALQVLNGTAQDDSYFVLVFTLDPEDDWADPKNWRKANPNLGVSVSYDNLAEAIREAQQNPSKQVSCLTKRLNVWCGAGARWMDMLKWDQCLERGLSLDDVSYRGYRAWVGMDLASKIDIAAIAILVELPDKRLALFHRYYMPEEPVQQNAHADYANYAAWAVDGYITLTPGPIIDFAYIRDDIGDIMERFEIESVGFDPWHATQIVTELLDQGVPMVSTRKTVQPFSQAMKEVDAWVRVRSLVHEYNPCTDWMMGNVTAKPDRKDNIFPVKDTPDQKIDGADALLYAVVRYLGQTVGVNPYNDPSFTIKDVAPPMTLQ